MKVAETMDHAMKRVAIEVEVSRALGESRLWDTGKLYTLNLRCLQNSIAYQETIKYLIVADVELGYENGPAKTHSAWLWGGNDGGERNNGGERAKGGDKPLVALTDKRLIAVSEPYVISLRWDEISSFTDCSTLLSRLEMQERSSRKINLLAIEPEASMDPVALFLRDRIYPPLPPSYTQRLETVEKKVALVDRKLDVILKAIPNLAAEVLAEIEAEMSRGG